MLYTPSFRYAARKPIGAKLALKPFHVWGIRVRLQVAHRVRDLALFDLALDSKLIVLDALASPDDAAANKMANSTVQ